MQQQTLRPIEGRRAWTGPQLQRDGGWITELSREELDDLDRALEAVTRAGLGWGRFEARQFPLSSFERRLAAIEHELIDGRGFVLLRGLQTSRYTVDELRAIYWGIATHLGPITSQNAKGSLMEDITNLAPENLDDVDLRSYVTAAGQPPHCDNTDVVGLLCVDRAAEGGDSVAVSTAAIYNRVLAQHPEYLECLRAGFHHDMRGEGLTGDANEVSGNRVPVFSDHLGGFGAWFHGKIIRGGTRKKGLELTSVQRDALDFVESCGSDPTLRLDMQLERGDIQLLNNYATMHYRTAFSDGHGHKRLMLRIWIQLCALRNLEPAFVRWVRPGIPAQSWARDRDVPATGIYRRKDTAQPARA